MKAFGSIRSLQSHKSKTAGSCFAETSPSEYNLIEHVPDDQKSVWCKQCGDYVYKREVFKHIECFHPECSDESWSWHIKGDYNMIKKGKVPDEYSEFNHGYSQKHAIIMSEQKPRKRRKTRNSSKRRVAPELQLDNPNEQYGIPSAIQVQEPPGHEQNPAVIVDGPEQRILKRIDDAVSGFNVILKQGLGEVQAKYIVSAAHWVLDYDPNVYGFKFPNNLLSSNFNIDDFKTTLLEFKCLNVKTVGYIMRDITRFLGCFVFPDEAGLDLANLLVSVFRSGAFKQVLTSTPWRLTGSYLKSLKVSLRHFVDHWEDEQRTIRAFGGLTTALQSIRSALEYQLSAQLRHKESDRKKAKAIIDSALIEAWVGSEVYKEMVLMAFMVLKYITDHARDDGF